MWNPTSSRPSLRIMLGWVLHLDSWANWLWYTLAGSGRGNTKRGGKKSYHTCRGKPVTRHFNELHQLPELAYVVWKILITDISDA